MRAALFNCLGGCYSLFSPCVRPSCLTVTSLCCLASPSARWLHCSVLLRCPLRWRDCGFNLSCGQPLTVSLPQLPSRPVRWVELSALASLSAYAGLLVCRWGSLPMLRPCLQSTSTEHREFCATPCLVVACVSLINRLGFPFLWLDCRSRFPSGSSRLCRDASSPQATSCSRCNQPLIILAHKANRLGSICSVQCL